MGRRRGKASASGVVWKCLLHRNESHQQTLEPPTGLEATLGMRSLVQLEMQTERHERRARSGKTLISMHVSTVRFVLLWLVGVSLEKARKFASHTVCNDNVTATRSTRAERSTLSTFSLRASAAGQNVAGSEVESSQTAVLRPHSNTACRNCV